MSAKKVSDGFDVHPVTGVTTIFDVHEYGKLFVDLQTGIFAIDDQQVKLTRSEANIVANFLSLGGERASVKTMKDLMGTTENSFKSMLSKARKKLSSITITGGVTADALLLSDRTSGETSNIILPYHFNEALADLVTKHGLGFDPELLKGVRTKVNIIIGVMEDSEGFLIATGQPVPPKKRLTATPLEFRK